ncbi:MAG: hypothetical protein NTY38_11185 [Acidobacteria bacterium]|nr:hypothetical protein [Acidobacteriota bacterium]
MVARRRLLLFVFFATTATGETVRFKDRCLSDLVAQVPKLLASQDRKTGRFGQGVWVVGKQGAILPLAAAWSVQDKRNPYYHSPEVLEAVMAGGDALAADEDENGEWEYRSKEGAEWGKDRMPWACSRWVRAYHLVREAMPAGRRTRWERGLLLAYTGTARQVSRSRVHNIEAHHAMGLYFAGQVFDKPEWCALARDYLHKVAAGQHPDGYWSEHQGPVVRYGSVYIDALGTYQAASRDEQVLTALRKAAVFHSYFTYPDGSDVETVDERNFYHSTVAPPNVGFTFSPEGRSYVARRLALLKEPLSADAAASLLMWGQEGEGAGRDLTSSDFTYELSNHEAAVRRCGPWFLVVSALTSPLRESRWIQDRQNFVSVFHDKTGLIAGGGNTKIQPSWSNFSLGDLNSWRPAIVPRRSHGGESNANFAPPAGLRHIPVTAKLVLDGAFGVSLDYGDARGEVRLEVLGPDRLAYTVSGDARLAAHLTLLPHIGMPLVSASGSRAVLGPGELVWDNPGGWIEHAGWRLHLPSAAAIRWPLLPHNPYIMDLHGELLDGRLVADAPAGEPRRFVIEVH